MKLLQKIKSGDTLIVTKLDRVSRSVQQGISLINDLLEQGVRVHVLNLGQMDDTPTGKLIRNIMFSFAEFERDMIVERTTEGKEIARQKPGYKEGRPKKVIDRSQFEFFRKKQKDGMLSVVQCCRELGISRRTWYNMCEG